MTKTSAKLANYLTKFGYHDILDRQESSQSYSKMVQNSRKTSFHYSKKLQLNPNQVVNNMINTKELQNHTFDYIDP